MIVLISIILLACSALFSGLTLGLLSINKNELERKIRLGDKRAEKIYEVRKNPNALLVTLLVGNVLVNSMLSIILGSFLSGTLAVIISTALIVIFGEILPQAFFAKHAMAYATPFIPFVKVLMFVLGPIVYPMAWALEKLIGKENDTVWNKEELEEIINDHSDSDLSDLEEHEGDMIIGALNFSDKKVGEIMTHKDDCFLLEETTVLTYQTLLHIKDMGFTRVPVYRDSLEVITGLLFTKDLIAIDDDTPIGTMVRKDSILQTKTDVALDDLLKRFIKTRKHMAYVLNTSDKFIGIITLEDILEEIIDQEIQDETDTDED